MPLTSPAGPAKPQQDKTLTQTPACMSLYVHLLYSYSGFWIKGLELGALSLPHTPSTSTTATLYVAASLTEHVHVHVEVDEVARKEAGGQGAGTEGGA